MNSLIRFGQSRLEIKISGNTHETTPQQVAPPQKARPLVDKRSSGAVSWGHCFMSGFTDYNFW